MKKLIAALVAAFFAVGAFAQTPAPVEAAPAAKAAKATGKHAAKKSKHHHKVAHKSSKSKKAVKAA